MTLETFTMLLVVFATLTSLVTEGIKKSLDSLKIKYAANILALYSSIIVGGMGTCIFYLWNKTEWSLNNVIWIFLMTGANWLGSMIGYDKVIQTITQLKSNKKDSLTEKG